MVCEFEPPLTGDDEGSTRQGFVDTDLVADERCSANELSACEGEREPASAGSSRPGKPREILSPVCCRDRRKMRQRRLETAYVLRGGAFLCREHHGRAVRTEQRAANVTRNLNQASVKRAVHAGKVDARKILEPGAAGADVDAVRVDEPCPQRLQHPGAAVGACAAADPDEDSMSAGVERDPDELAGTPRCGMERVERPRVNASKPGSLGKLDHRLTGAEPPEPGNQRVPERSGDPVPGQPPSTPPGGEQDVERAVPAVGDRHLNGVRTRVANAARDRRRGRACAQRALERVRRAHDKGCGVQWR